MWQELAGKALNWIPSIVGSALTYSGTKQTNELNQKLAREQTEFQKASTQEQMDFQERMSNTAYQRMRKDLEQAGFNPMLAVNQGGASTPQGSSAIGARAEMQNKMKAAVNSAIAIKQAQAELELTREAIKSARYENVGKKAESKIDQTMYGKVMRGLQRLNPFIKSGSSAISVMKR